VTRPLDAWPILALLAVLAACSQSHDPDSDAGPPAGRDAGACASPAVTVVVRTDYVAGEDVAAINVEVNDVIVLAVPVTASDDLAAGLELGRVCALRPNSRITVRLLTERGTDVDGGQVTLESPMDGGRVAIVISR